MDSVTKTLGTERIRCINQEMGIVLNTQDWNKKCLISTGNLQSHQLFSTIGTESLWQAMKIHDCLALPRQIHGSNLRTYIN